MNDSIFLYAYKWKFLQAITGKVVGDLNLEVGTSLSIGINYLNDVTLDVLEHKQ